MRANRPSSVSRFHASHFSPTRLSITYLLISRYRYPTISVKLSQSFIVKRPPGSDRFSAYVKHNVSEAHEYASFPPSPPPSRSLSRSRIVSDSKRVIFRRDFFFSLLSLSLSLSLFSFFRSRPINSISRILRGEKEGERKKIRFVFD